MKKILTSVILVFALGAFVSVFALDNDKKERVSAKVENNKKSTAAAQKAGEAKACCAENKSEKAGEAKPCKEDKATAKASEAKSSACCTNKGVVAEAKSSGKK